MSSTIRLALVLLGVLCYAASVRANIPWLRWAAIACVGAAIVLRIVDRLRDKL